MFETGLPSSHVALVWSHPLGTRLRDRVAAARRRRREACGCSRASRWRRRRAGSWSGESPPPAVKEKSCGSSGVASFTTTIWPRLRFANVHVTTSAGRDVDVRHRAAVVAGGRGLVPPARHRLGDRVPASRVRRPRTCACSTACRRSRRRGGSSPGDSPPPAVNEKSCGSSGVASFTTTISPALLDREGAGHHLARLRR